MELVDGGTLVRSKHVARWQRSPLRRLLLVVLIILASLALRVGGYARHPQDALSDHLNVDRWSGSARGCSAVVVEIAAVSSQAFQDTDGGALLWLLRSRCLDDSTGPPLERSFISFRLLLN